MCQNNITREEAMGKVQLMLGIGKPHHYHYYGVTSTAGHAFLHGHSGQGDLCLTTGCCVSLWADI